MVACIVVGSGRRRYVFDMNPSKDARQGVASDIKRFLFPSNGAYFKAKRRGERALSPRTPVV